MTVPYSLSLSQAKPWGFTPWDGGPVMSRINSALTDCEPENFSILKWGITQREKKFKPPLALLTTAGPKPGQLDQRFTTCPVQEEPRAEADAESVWPWNFVGERRELRGVKGDFWTEPWNVHWGELRSAGSGRGPICCPVKGCREDSWHSRAL